MYRRGTPPVTLPGRMASPRERALREEVAAPPTHPGPSIIEKQVSGPSSTRRTGVPASPKRSGSSEPKGVGSRHRHTGRVPTCPRRAGRASTSTSSRGGFPATAEDTSTSTRARDPLHRNRGEGVSPTHSTTRENMEIISTTVSDSPPTTKLKHPPSTERNSLPRTYIGTQGGVS